MIKKWKKFNELYVQSQSIKCVNDEVDFSVLTKLEDERDSLMEGDEVIATYFSGGFDTYQFILEKWFDPNKGCYVLGTADDYTIYTIEDAYHIVKKETYNDFVEPDKILESDQFKLMETVNQSIVIRIIYASRDLRDACEDALCEGISSAFNKIHAEYNTVSGDARFTEKDLLDKDAIDTMVEQVTENMDITSVIKSIKTDNINLELFKEMKDEREYITEGDRILIVTSDSNVYWVLKDTPSPYDGFRKAWIEMRGAGKNFLGIYILECNMEDLPLSIIEDSIYIVRKDTYEDFGGEVKYLRPTKPQK